MSKNLVVYFSHTGENYVNGGIKNLSKGNTEIIAEMIAKAVGGDLVEIVPVKQYNYDYYKCIDEAKVELRADARPEIKVDLDSVDGYEIVYLGYPNWWGTMPMCVFTFLEKFDWTGKTIVPFCTNEGSGMGSSESDIKRICKGATVLKGLPIHGAEAKNSESKVLQYLKSMKG